MSRRQVGRVGSVVVLCVLALGTALAVAQEAPSRAERKAAFSRALNKNRNALLLYRWKTRIEIRVGKKKPIVVLEDRWYDDKGSLQRKRRTEAVAKDDSKKKDKMLETLYFANSYLYMDFIELEKFFRKADFTEPTGDGPLLVELRDYLTNGDFVRVQINPEPIRALEAHVDTFFQGDPMTVHAKYEKSGGLPNIVARTTITVPLRKLEVVIESSDLTLK